MCPGSHDQNHSEPNRPSQMDDSWAIYEAQRFAELQQKYGHDFMQKNTIVSEIQNRDCLYTCMACYQEPQLKGIDNVEAHIQKRQHRNKVFWAEPPTPPLPTGPVQAVPRPSQAEPPGTAPTGDRHFKVFSYPLGDPQLVSSHHLPPINFSPRCIHNPATSLPKPERNLCMKVYMYIYIDV